MKRGSRSGSTVVGKARNGYKRGLLIDQHNGGGHSHGRYAGGAGANGNDKSNGVHKRKRKRKDRSEMAEQSTLSMRDKDDEEIESDQEDDIDDDGDTLLDGEKSEKEQKQDGAEENETEKRLRVAKELLARMRKEEMGSPRKSSKRARDDDGESEELEESEEEDGEEDDIREKLTSKLRKDILLASGKMHRPYAELLRACISKHGMDAFSLPDTSTSKNLGRINFRVVHALPITCLAVDVHGTVAFTASKDGAIVRWDIESGVMTHKVSGIRKSLASFPKLPKEQHVGAVLALALSTDDRYLVSGGADKAVRMWNPVDLSFVACIQNQHKSPITSLSFRYDSATFFSGSDDRAIRVWNASDQLFIEPFYGHRAEITSTDALMRECVLSGSADRTIRLWKVPEQTHLVFECLPSQMTGSIDCVRMLDESHFISGSQDGTIALWNVGKRKPTSMIKVAHGEGVWIVSLASMVNSDIFASGASDGTIKLWQVDFVRKSILPEPVAVFPNVPGFINGLAFDRSGKVLVAGIGTEHRMGRWKKIVAGAREGSDGASSSPIVKARNQVIVFRLPAMVD